MALVKTPDGTYRFSFYHPCERFTLQRYGALERTEAHPNGVIVKFVVTDCSDHSIMTIDEEDAEQLDTLLTRLILGEIDGNIIERHLAHIFDELCPPTGQTQH